MKKQLTTTVSAFAALFTLMAPQGANAQLKVYPDGKVYVGDITTTPLSKLCVGGAGTAGSATGYFFDPAPVRNASAIVGEVAVPPSRGYVYGVTGIGHPGTAGAVGVCGKSVADIASNYANGWGVYGIGTGLGVRGELSSATDGAGILGYDGFSVQPSISGPYAGYFVGRIATTDPVAEKPGTTTWTVVSDTRLKKDVKDFKDGLNVIRQIRPVNFNYNGTGGLPTEKTYIGVIAQEVQKVAPYCIGKSQIALKSSEKSAFGSDIVGERKNSEGASESVAEVLNYNQDGLFYAMINSIKELDTKNKELDIKIADLEKQLKLTTGQYIDPGKDEKTSHLELANTNQAILYQNEPNPFDGATVIRYFIPENTAGTAFVTFYDMYGKEVNKLEVKEKGFGKIEAGTSNLANGIYSYSIIVNNKIIDTKRMIKSK